MVLFGGWRREHFLNRWGKRVVRILPYQFHITLQRARIFHQVILVVELHRIDENGDKHDFIFQPCALDQGKMTIVQRTHSGHQTDGFAFRFNLIYNTGKFCNSVNYEHNSSKTTIF